MTEPLLTEPKAGVIAVASLKQARRHKRRFDAVITIEDPLAKLKLRLRFHQDPRPQHLILRFEDVDWNDLGLWIASAEDVSKGIEFARLHVHTSVLVHCFHGIGRSAGLGLAILADRMGASREDDALASLLAIRPQACPNRIVVEHADVILNRRGRLIAALDKWEATSETARERRAARRIFIEKNLHLYAPIKTET